MLKRKIDKAAFDALSADIKAVYSEVDGAYVLQAEGDDVSALKAAKEHEKVARQAAETELREFKAGEATKIAKAEETARTAALKDARDNKDYEALDASWKAKYKALETEKDGVISGLNSAVHTERVTSASAAIANTIAVEGAGSLLQPLIEKRLTVEMVDGKFTTRVLDKAGQPSAMTLDELSTEFATADQFKAVIKGGAAAGGGSHNKPGGGAPKQFADMSVSERVELKNSDPAAYNSVRDSHVSAKSSQLRTI